MTERSDLDRSGIKPWLAIAVREPRIFHSTGQVHPAVKYETHVLPMFALEAAFELG